MGNKGRVQDWVPKGSFVCEYESSTTYQRKHRKKHEEEYAKNGEGCFILDILTSMPPGCIPVLGVSSTTLQRVLPHSLPTSLSRLVVYGGLVLQPRETCHLVLN